jgi:hypothetical protein
MVDLTAQELADLLFWIGLVLGSVICFGLGFIAGQQR